MEMQRISAAAECAPLRRGRTGRHRCSLPSQTARPGSDGTENPFHTAWAAVVFSAWYCGVGPSILALLRFNWGLVLVSAAGGFFSTCQPEGRHLWNAGLRGLFRSYRCARRSEPSFCLAGAVGPKNNCGSAHAELERRVQERTAELSTANENLRELSGQLQQLRDEERKQIARELHDSVGQLLAALSMNVATLQSQSHKLDPGRRHRSV